MGDGEYASRQHTASPRTKSIPFTLLRNPVQGPRGCRYNGRLPQRVDEIRREPAAQKSSVEADCSTRSARSQWRVFSRTTKPPEVLTPPAAYKSKNVRPLWKPRAIYMKGTFLRLTPYDELRPFTSFVLLMPVVHVNCGVFAQVTCFLASSCQRGWETSHAPCHRN